MKNGVLLFGVDPSTGRISPVFVDSNGHIQIDAVTTPILVDVAGHAQVDVITQPILVDGAGHAQVDVLTQPILLDGANHAQVDVLSQPILIDGSGHAQVDVLTSPAIQANSHGYISGAWKKNPIQFGYSDTIQRTMSHTNLSAGSGTLADSAVPAGEIWVITTISFTYIGTVTGVRLRPDIVAGGVGCPLLEQEIAMSGKFYGFQGWWVLEEDDYLQLSISNATAGDDVYYFAIGFKVDINL